MKANKSPYRKIQRIPTGVAKLDTLLVGGIKVGYMTQFSGATSTGKSSICAMIAAEAQKQGMDVLWFDTERRFKYDLFESLGLDLSRVELVSGGVAETVFDEAEKWAEKEKNCLIVIDSIGGLKARKDSEAKSGEEGFPVVPRLIPPFLRRISDPLQDNKNTLLFINHEKKEFESNAIKTLGGDAVKYAVDDWVRFRLVSNAEAKDTASGEVVGQVVECQVKKGSRVKQTAQLVLLNSGGFSRDYDLMDKCIELGILTRTGNTIWHKEEKLGLVNKARAFIQENPTLQETLKAELQAVLAN